jgi:hypothetical protein
MIGAPAEHRGTDVQSHAALRRELHRVGKQVLHDLHETLGVRDHAAAEARIEVGREREVTRFGLVTEIALDRLAQLREREVLAFDRNGAGLDLRQVEDVRDEVQQVRARGVDGLRELHLARGQVGLRVLRQLLPQDQDAVERSAQLVRHVRQELGLVA